MTTYTDLTTTILQAKCYVGCKASQFSNKEKNGDDIICCEKPMMLLSFLIEIAENYKCANFNSNGNPITATCPTLTANEAQLLVSKMKGIMK